MLSACDVALCVRARGWGEECPERTDGGRTVDEALAAAAAAAGAAPAAPARRPGQVSGYDMSQSQPAIPVDLLRKGELHQNATD